MAYLKNVDVTWNFAYIIFIALWSVFYVESWKRKQATIQYIWGLTEKEDQIRKSIKRPQKGIELTYDEYHGKITKVVNQGKTCCTWFSNFLILLIFPALAIAAGIFTVKMIDAIDIDEENVTGKNWWTMFTMFLNAVIVAILTKFFF